MSLKAIDFFCGIGGVTHGFLKKGIDVVAGIDSDITCKETYEINNIRPNGKSSKFIYADITNFDTSLIKKLISPEDKLILIGCAPCQPFTKITNKLDKRKKERGLLQCFSKIILELNPSYLFLENVQGLSSKKNKKVLEDFIVSLRPNFDLIPRIINAKNFGVPQSRKRVILFGKLEGTVDYPKEIYGEKEKSKTIKTLFDTIGKLPPIQADEKYKNYKTHIACKLTDKSIKRLEFQKNPGDGMETWPPELLLKSRTEKNVTGVKYDGHRDVYARLWWDKPCGTLTTKFVSISNGRFAHPEQNRGLSILEGLLIQTFPKSFKMRYPIIRQQAKHIGNAVPVKLAEAFAKKIIEDDHKEKSIFTITKLIGDAVPPKLSERFGKLLCQ